MKFLYSLSGANIPVIREFDIIAAEKYEAGQVVKCTTDGTVSINAPGPCLGVAAEDHSGKEDILNERADGTKLRIDITKDGVYGVAAPKLTATKTGTATTFVCDGTLLSTNLAGAKLVLVAKGENSQNTDALGCERKVTGVAVSSNVATISVTAGGVADAGDVYMLIPTVGFSGYVSDDKSGFVCLGSSGVGLKVIGGNSKTGILEVLITSKMF